MDDKKIMIGGGVVIAVLFVGALIFGGGNGDDKLGDMISGKLAPVSDSVAALDGRMEEMQTAVDAQIAEMSEAFEAQVAGLQENLDALASQSEGAASSDDLAGLQAQIDALAAAATQATAAVSVPETAPAAQEATATAPVEVAAGAFPGETVILSEGALRVFVSRLTEENARLAVVGGKMVTLSDGATRTVQAGDTTCRLTLASVAAGANLAATCGADMPAPEGLTVGNTAVMADGALRVFVSRVMDEDNAARLSVGGATFELQAGEIEEVTAGDATCNVSLDGVDRGHAQVSGSC